MRGRIRSQSGAAMYESILTLPIFLALVFMGIEGMILGYKSLVIQYAATQGVRKIALGVCAGPYLNATATGVGNNNSTENELTCNPVDPLITGSTQEQRARYAFHYTRLVAWRFGVRLTSDAATGCVRPLAANLDPDCTNDFAGVPEASGATATVASLQIRTVDGFLGNLIHIGTGYRLSGFAIARVERKLQ